MKSLNIHNVQSLRGVYALLLVMLNDWHSNPLNKSLKKAFKLGYSFGISHGRHKEEDEVVPTT